MAEAAALGWPGASSTQATPRLNLGGFFSPRVWYRPFPAAHDIGDVGGEHEIRLGISHHGRVATHGDYQKNHFKKDFPEI